MRTLSQHRMILLIIATALFVSCPVTRSHAARPLTLQELQTRLLELEKKVAAQQKIIDDYRGVQVEHSEQHEELEHKKVGKVRARKKKGSIFAEPAMPGTFKIGANITGIVQGSPDAKLLGQDKREVVGGSYQANVTLANEFTNVNGLAVANLRIDQGHGIEDEITAYSNVDNNVWAYDYFTLSELFYEQHLFDDRLIINFGKLDPTVFFDTNRYADSDTTQFLARIFNNSPVLEFPENAGGIRAAIYPYDWLELGYLAMAGQGNLKNLQSNQFHVGNIHFKPRFNNLQGNYRFLTWINTNYHTKWTDTSKDKEYNYGFSLSCDQEIHKNIGIFGKFGWQNPKVYNPLNVVFHEDAAAVGTTPEIYNYSLEYMWSGGVEVKGQPWGRAHDFLGVAVGQAIPSPKIKDALDGTAGNRNAKTEGHFETYYSFYFNKYLAISPSIQLVWNPYGGDSESNDVISVYTIRSHVDF